MTDADLLTADAAAALLGVSRATLYAYVSRGLVASEEGPGPSRARRYPRASIEAFVARRERGADRGLAAHGALDWGLPVVDSALTLIADGLPHYRGHDAIALARTQTFERVAALLWTGSADTALDLRAPPWRGRGAVGEAPSLDALVAHLAAPARASLVTMGSPREAVLRAAARCVAGLFRAAGARGDGPLATRLATGWGCCEAAALDAALVLAADHELNVSAFTARCVASADTRVEDVLLAALCALRGRRHGGMIARVEDLLADVARLGAREAAARGPVESGAPPGFGHPLYPDGDPRGRALVERARAFGADPDLDALIDVVGDDLGLAPTLDLGLVALARALRLPAGAAFCLFALGRSAGWVAHALEAWDQGALMRPRSRYVGPDPVA